MDPNEQKLKAEVEREMGELEMSREAEIEAFETALHLHNELLWRAMGGE